MTTKKNFEISLYKNKLNTKTLIDLLPNLSTKTIDYISRDLNLNPTEKNTETDVLYVFSDGGCKGNGKKYAKAAYSIFFTDDKDSIFYNFNATRQVITEPTNNKAELSGIKSIYKTIHENPETFSNLNIIICTDSIYSINCIEKWAKNWIKNDWKNSKGEQVKNKEIIQAILNYKSSIENNSNPPNIKFKHVFSHTQEPSDKNSLQYRLWYGNNCVDENINKILNLM